MSKFVWALLLVKETLNETKLEQEEEVVIAQTEETEQTIYLVTNIVTEVHRSLSRNLEDGAYSLTTRSYLPRYPLSRYFLNNSSLHLSIIL